MNECMEKGKTGIGKHKERDGLEDAMDIDNPIGKENKLKESKYEPPMVVSKKSNCQTRSSS